MKTKGVLLCGGEGTRLRPLTEVVNKHLVRVVDRPMAEYPLLKMIEAGIDEILIVTGGENFAGVCKYFGSGHKWGVSIRYAIQDQPGGIAQAVGLAESFVGDNRVLVCLGDNLWTMSIKAYLSLTFYSCVLFSIETKIPERFGVFQFEGKEVVNIIEKPKEFVSNQACTGIYIYDSTVFDVIKDLKPSERGELEISDVNRFYIKKAATRIVPMDGWWSDCGTIETLIQTEELLKNEGRPISSVRAKRSN